MIPITPRTEGDRIVLSKMIGGKRYKMLCGNAGNPTHWIYARRIAAIAQSEIENGTFQGFRQPQELKDERAAHVAQDAHKRLLKSKDGMIRSFMSHVPDGVTLASPKQISRVLSQAPISKATKRRYLSAIRNLLPEWASLIVIDKKVPSDIKKEISVFRGEEWDVFLGASVGSARDAFMALYKTGLRPGELLALEPGDWDGKRLTVDKAMKKVGSTYRVGPTKNKKVRTLTLSGGIAALLDKLVAQETALGSRYLFMRDRYYPWTYDALRSSFEEAAHRARLKGKTLYSLRRSAITRWLENGVPVATVAKWAGNTPTIIYRHYAGVVQDKDIPD